MTSKCGEVASLSRKENKGLDQPLSRFLGLSLGGGKSSRTSLTIIDHYKSQKKSFVLDSYDGIGPSQEHSADHVLCDLLEEISSDFTPQIIAVDAPLTFPPCLLSCLESCESVETCRRDDVVWMRKQYQKALQKNKKLKMFTPYSQRPIDLYYRYQHLDQEIFQDETMGANLAPIAARMSFLKQKPPLNALRLIEVWPKLVVFNLQKSLKISKSEFLKYRNLENGVEVRTKILERMIDKFQIFIYERDLKKLVSNTSSFDSFILAWMALQSGLDNCSKPKSDFPVESGWVESL